MNGEFPHGLRAVTNLIDKRSRSWTSRLPERYKSACKIEDAKRDPKRNDPDTDSPVQGPEKCDSSSEEQKQGEM
ncbi:hypothetical protein EXIGLDRAFT_735294 [Exidia glandulosa HHB12029]|uniref:Uncharacterized protein n=1 Tax=Exidia glandulosa HHB12029 TaxID=1314781 RepID=A0A165JVU5_EXIGL|nr:hypothetical protein EXIGLDRAFT_735294 [Exidia glandulosa HHB12029]